MNDTGRFRGGCFCGAVRFSIQPPTKWCAHCHCSMCRRAHGAGFVTWVGVAEDRFQIESGQDSLRFFASSPEAKRGFCNTCGSTFLFQSTKWAGEMHVALANVDGPIDREPQAHVYPKDKASWIHVDDGLKWVEPS